jgi:hypothetical protein
MSIWQDHGIEEKIVRILQDVPDSAEQHHLGRPFLTAYQIAIEFAHRHPDVFNKLGWPVGGRGIGQSYSLAKYLAGRLSQRIRDGRLEQIEGGFISNQHLQGILFDNVGETIQSSLTESGHTLSLFRLRE